MNGVGPIALQQAPAKPEQAEKVAEQLEAHFLTHLLEQMHGESSAFGEGFSGSVYRGMLDEKLGETMAQSSPLGLKDMIARQLQQQAPSATVLPAGFTRVSSPYGLRTHPITGEHKFHHGLDLAAPEGTPVPAAAPGTVIFSGEQNGFGKVVEIAHADGTTSLYAHLRTQLVPKGAVVNAGQAIGEVGQTGTATGPHLHLEVRKGGKSCDPASWLTTSGLTSTRRQSTEGAP